MSNYFTETSEGKINHLVKKFGKLTLEMPVTVYFTDERGTNGKNYMIPKPVRDVKMNLVYALPGGQTYTNRILK